MSKISQIRVAKARNVESSVLRCRNSMSTKEKPPFLCRTSCDSFFLGTTTTMVLFHRYFLLLCGIATSAAALEIKATNDYSFETYMQEFHKMYTSAEEYERRKSIFLENLATIIGHNKERESSEYYMDLNQFTDMSDAELPLGYDKSFHSAWKAKAAISSTARNVRIDIAALTTNLPSSIDWRSKGSVTTTVKNQGGCGSCWAFASTAALESHIAIQTGKLFALSVQELVSCVPNPRDCGGQGGCAGSTAELAYDFVAKRGVVDEWNFGYQSYHGKHVNCTIMEDTSKNLRGSNSTNIKGAVASIVGFSNLASNHYASLLLAVATLGPVVVNVAANGWGLYKGGVFDDDKKQDRDINHAVVLEGYGTDQETGQDYWLIRNSWGPIWGEDGYIRLKRVDPATLDDPSSDCKMDVKPADGIACSKDETGHDITPKAVSVCGTSGVLFDGVVPIGGHLL